MWAWDGLGASLGIEKYLAQVPACVLKVIKWFQSEVWKDEPKVIFYVISV